jgi:hypothetical protein
VVAISGCSNGGGASTARTTTSTTLAAAAAGSACERLPSADVTRFFGEPAVTPAVKRPGSVGVVSACFYEVDGSSGQLLQFRIYASDQYYARVEHPDAQDVAGLGERAFVSKTGPDGVVSCQFVKHVSVYALSYSNLTNNAAAKADALVALARDLAGRV